MMFGLFERNMKFGAVCAHSNIALLMVGNRILECGAEIEEVQEADMVMDADNSYVDTVYVIQCVGKKSSYKKIKTVLEYNKELIYEGMKTLVWTNENEG